MKFQQCRVPSIAAFISLTAVALALTGCQSPNYASPPPRDQIPPLQVGESIQVELTGTPQVIAPLSLTVSEAGTITLPLLPKPITAVGLSARELEGIIRSNYIPDIYKEVNVTVTMGPRFYYVRGEINQTGSGKQPYTGHVTVLGAVSAAGGFNDYAASERVRLTWPDGRSYLENCAKATENPTVDWTVLPNDLIFVPRKTLFEALGFH